MLPLLITIVKGAVTVAPAVEAAVRMRRAREAVEPAKDLTAERDLLMQLLQSHQIQARQRSFTLGAFVVALAVLALTYTVALVGDLPVLAAINAVIGAALVVFFNRFDASNRARVAVVEREYREQDLRLVAAGDPSRAGLVPQAGGLSHTMTLLVLQALAFWGFFAAFVYAVVEAA